MATSREGLWADSVDWWLVDHLCWTGRETGRSQEPWGPPQPLGYQVSWASQVNSLSLNFFTCKVDMVMPTPKGCSEIKYNSARKALRPELGTK